MVCREHVGRLEVRFVKEFPVAITIYLVTFDYCVDGLLGSCCRRIIVGEDVVGDVSEVFISKSLQAV
jgi:hypothetical protein